MVEKLVLGRSISLYTKKNKYKIVHGCAWIWNLFASVQLDSSQVSAANE